MKNTKFRSIKTRKDHTCIGCNKTIERGTICQYVSFRSPKLNSDDIQTGIEYVKMWLHG